MQIKTSLCDISLLAMKKYVIIHYIQSMKIGETMNKWFYFNFLVLTFAVWKVATSNLYPYIFFGAIGLSLILFNWTRHAVFSTLRSSMDRNRKIKYAMLSKRVLPFHKWIGTTALLMIVVHAVLVIRQFGFHLTNLKMLIGLLTSLILTSVVLTGWLRLYKPSIRKRLAHLWFGLTMFFLMALHLVLSF